MSQYRRWWQIERIFFLVYLFLSLFPAVGGTQNRSPAIVEIRTPQQVQMVLGSSSLITNPLPIARLSLASPTIADVVVISPTQLYLSAKAIGTTTLTLWGENERVLAIFDVIVSLDLARLKEKLREILPNEDIQVTSTHDSVTLFGTVSSAVRLTQALAVTKAFVGEKIVNLLEVGGVQQVMLEVRVAEMSRSLTKRLGFNWTSLSGSAVGFSFLNGLTALQPGTALFDPSILVRPAINSIVGFHQGGVTVAGFVDALKQQGLAHILAEPTLVTLSGQEASFLAGGEFPIPIAQGDNRIAIEFKQFGVGLVFTPTVLSGNKISMRVAPEVSELDVANAVNFSGFVIPALTTRRASTVIELGDGQSFVIAGLLNENLRELVAKFPLLGDIPVLGALFRSTSYQKNETELIILVTPRLVKPIDQTKQPLPGDQFVEPDDFEFMLLGQLEGKKRLGGGRRLDGKFGYIAP